MQLITEVPESVVILDAASSSSPALFHFSGKPPSEKRNMEFRGWNLNGHAVVIAR
jgi:hypothetical protein